MCFLVCGSLMHSLLDGKRAHSLSGVEKVGRRTPLDCDKQLPEVLSVCSVLSNNAPVNDLLTYTCIEHAPFILRSYKCAVSGNSFICYQPVNATASLS